jgi:hypothetical protein
METAREIDRGREMEIHYRLRLNNGIKTDSFLAIYLTKVPKMSLPYACTDKLLLTLSFNPNVSLVINTLWNFTEITP